MARLSRRQVVLGMLPCLAVALGACGGPPMRAPSGAAPAIGTVVTPRAAIATRPGIVASSPVATRPVATATIAVASTTPSTTAAQAGTPTISQFLNPQGTPARALPPFPYRQVPYDPATAIGGVPGYFFVPESVPDDPHHADLLRALWRYYAVRFDGEATLQTARFAEVMDGQALTSAYTMVDSLRGSGHGRRYLSLDGIFHPHDVREQPASLDEVKPLLMGYTNDRAELFSLFNASIFRTDPMTGQREERIPDHDEEMEEFFTMHRIADGWKVTAASFGSFRKQS